MSRVRVFLELPAPPDDAAFEMNREASESASESVRQSELLLRDLGGYGIEPDPDYPPIPLFSRGTIYDPESGFENFRSGDAPPDVRAETVVIAAWVDEERIEEVRALPGVAVWPDSQYKLLGDAEGGASDLALLAGVDCEPFQPPVPFSMVQDLLGARQVWQAGPRGQGVVVGIIDNGIEGNVYPVVGGFAPSGSFAAGRAPVTSHGSMCAFAVLTAAPEARLHDYRFQGQAGALAAFRLFQEVLNNRRRTGLPHITTNSYGNSERPPRASNPFHDVWNINHPLHKKVREVIAAGVTTLFAAGNCGAPCRQPDCHPSSVGPGASIHSANSLPEVITVAAVNSRRQRVGYSAQGPGGFAQQKPELCAYTHYFGNFGPGRPAGTSVRPFDDGTSASAPLAAGVAALLLSANPRLTPLDIKRILVSSADNLGAPGWNPDTGFGVVNAAAAFARL